MNDCAWSHTDIADLIAQFISDRTAVAKEQVLTSKDLAALPGFNSFVAAECLDWVEDRAGLDADVGKFTNDMFLNVHRMARVFHV